jgi:DNA-binding transcriptional ArsR family regulator
VDGEGEEPTRRRVSERHDATVEQLKALAHPLRLRVLRLCLGHARTNAELAERLNIAPGSMLRHVKLLVGTGFLVPQSPRPGPRGVTERPYLATGLSWRISLEVGDPTLSHRAELAVIDAYRAELAEADDDAWMEGVRMPLWLTAAERADLIARMGALIDEFHGRRGNHDDGGDRAERFSFLWSMHAERNADG